MRIINLTPHALHIRRADGTDITIEPSGIVPRLEVSRAECVPVLCKDGVEIAVSRATFGALTGMPETSLECSFCGTVTIRSHFYKPFDFEHDPKGNRYLTSSQPFTSGKIIGELYT